MPFLHPSRPTRARGDIPTSSMADIAFLLLVFFLVTTVFDDERGLSLVLPEADRPVPVSPANVLHLWVLGDGTVEVKRGASPRTSSPR
jgi:biopolymer transport protein ExbD